MATITIRNIDEVTLRQLRLRSARSGRSMEDEVRDILRSALRSEAPRPRNPAQTIHARFAAIGGVDLPEMPREPIREPPELHQPEQASVPRLADLLLAMPQDDSEFSRDAVRKHDTDL